MVHQQEKIIEARQLRAEGKLLREIAERFGVSLSTASLWVRGVLPSGKQAAVPRKSETLSILSRMYREGHPVPEIAKITGVPPGTLFDWRRELELPKNKRAVYVTNDLRARISRKLSRDPDGEHKREAARLYIEDQLSTPDIAKIIGVTSQSIGEWLKGMDVPIRTAVTLRTRQKLRAASTGEKRWNWKGVSRKSVYACAPI